MEAGKLKDKVVFQKMIVSTDDYGHEITEYLHAFSTRADVIWNNGNRIVSNEEIFYENTVTFIVRFYTQIEDTMRIQYNGNLYRIISINPEKETFSRKTIIAELINE